MHTGVYIYIYICVYIYIHMCICVYIYRYTDRTMQISSIIDIDRGTSSSDFLYSFECAGLRSSGTRASDTLNPKALKGFQV